jgi:hypothetical protein
MRGNKDWPENAFEVFWLQYPRRVAKKAARSAFERVRKSGEVDFDTLVAGVRNYAAAVAGKDMQYVAHPATWLNQGRWDDEPAAIAGKPANSVADVFARLCDEAGENIGWVLPQIGRG